MSLLFILTFPLLSFLHFKLFYFPRNMRYNFSSNYRLRYSLPAILHSSLIAVDRKHCTVAGLFGVASSSASQQLPAVSWCSEDSSNAPHPHRCTSSSVPYEFLYPVITYFYNLAPLFSIIIISLFSSFFLL